MNILKLIQSHHHLVALRFLKGDSRVLISSSLIPLITLAVVQGRQEAHQMSHLTLGIKP